MKRFFSSFALVVMILFFMPSAFAEGSTSPAETITFRGIDWFETFKNVKEVFDKIGDARIDWYSPIKEKVTVSEWDDTKLTPIQAREGGVRLIYLDVPVAGYTAETTYLFFTYPVVEGKVQYDTEESQFCKAKYVIGHLADVESAYNDLAEKLSNLYGEPVDHSDYNLISKKDNPKGLLWTADDGSVVWMAIYYNDSWEHLHEIKITYAAPNLADRLNNLNEQIKMEARNSEAEARRENSSNYGGL